MRGRGAVGWAVGCIALAVAATALVAGLLASGPGRPLQPESPSASGELDPGLSTAPTPRDVVIQAPRRTGPGGVDVGPGAVQVVNTETHDVVRTLPTSVSRTDTGFQVTPAERALYFDYFDGHHFQIVAVPLDGGPPRGLADGDTFALSANGKLLAVTGETDAHGGTPPAHPSVRIVSARTGRAVASIRMSVHGVLRSMAWVAGEPALLVVVQEGMGCVLGGISAPCDGPGPISVAYLLDVEGNRMHASKVPASRSLPVGLAGWTTVRLSAPGPTAGTVLATSRTGALKILVVRASDGQVLHQYLPPSPPGDLSVNVRGVDASGRHFLLAATQARTTRLWQWTPPSPRLTLVGPADVEASW